LAKSKKVDAAVESDNSENPTPEEENRNVKNPNLEAPDEELLREEEIEKRSRARSRGSSRKSKGLTKKI
jgi:hypothetical protein